MTYRGRIKNGVVVFDEPVSLPDGTEVNVVLPLSSEELPHQEKEATLYDLLEPVIGKAEGLPPDASLNIDHYLYGAPKK